MVHVDSTIHGHKVRQHLQRHRLADRQHRLIRTLYRDDHLRQCRDLLVTVVAHCKDLRALLTQLRNKFKTDGSIYRVFPNGEVQYLHPKDGVYPEKVNKGRQGVGVQDRRIGENTNPVKVGCSPLPC